MTCSFIDILLSLIFLLELIVSLRLGSLVAARRNQWMSRMSLFDEQRLPRAGGPVAPKTSTTSSSHSKSSTSVADINLDPVDAHRQAREIVRLVQCTQCSLLLTSPYTLPCGASLCRECIPPTYTPSRLVSILAVTDREECFDCPFAACRVRHALADCRLDVTLSKILDRAKTEMEKHKDIAPDSLTLLDERPHWRNVVDSSKDQTFPSSTVLAGGRLWATFSLAQMGGLRYDSEVAYQTMSRVGDTYESLDKDFLDKLQEAAKSELDCEVCYALLLDPLTTPCGHTFCRRCVARTLDHSSSCPICRRSLFLEPGVKNIPGNRRLAKLLETLCPDLIAARAELVSQEESQMSGEKNVPLFVCTLAYPAMPTFLHVFEPRYRLMIRRAVESGNRKFGMMMYNQTSEAQDGLGRVHFMAYGTLLHINNVQMLMDGRSLIETVGVGRFRAKKWGMQDGYIVSDIEMVEDVSAEEEAALEAAEMQQHQYQPIPPSSPPQTENEDVAMQDHDKSPTTQESSPTVSHEEVQQQTSTDSTQQQQQQQQQQHDTPPQAPNTDAAKQPPLESLSNQDLHSISKTFISRMRLVSAPWLNSAHTAIYGPPPDDDPALFPYWFASVLPISEEEKYKLLPTRSVRERLKVTADWVRKIEARRW